MNYFDYNRRGRAKPSDVVELDRNAESARILRDHKGAAVGFEVRELSQDELDAIARVMQGNHAARVLRALREQPPKRRDLESWQPGPAASHEPKCPCGYPDVISACGRPAACYQIREGSNA